ncbi:hypothetical protein ABK040_005364 [Willaertia magna]
MILNNKKEIVIVGYYAIFGSGDISIYNPLINNNNCNDNCENNNDSYELIKSEEFGEEYLFDNIICDENNNYLLNDIIDKCFVLFNDKLIKIKEINYNLRLSDKMTFNKEENEIYVIENGESILVLK